MLALCYKMALCKHSREFKRIRKANVNFLIHPHSLLSSAGLFRLSGRLENGEKGIKRAGAGEKGNESARDPSHRTPRAAEFYFPVLSLFPRFLAVSPLKEALQRREPHSLE